MNNTSNIIYIIGSGRSGTTLLDILLGNGNNIFSAGELNRFTKRNGIPHDARDDEVTCFWKKVNEDLLLKKFDEPKAYCHISKKYEYHLTFYNLFLPSKTKKSFNIYSDFQKHLFESVERKAKETFNKSIIVDSSKYPMRAILLSKIFNDISFIYLRRNPSAVVESFQKKDVEQPSKSRLMAHLYLLTVNTLSKHIIKILRKTNRVSEISYDDLLQSPVAALKKIESELNIDLDNSKKLIEKNEPLKVGLLFDGNRLRLENEIVFRKGDAETKPKKMSDRFFYGLHKLFWYKPLKIN